MAKKGTSSHPLF